VKKVAKRAKVQAHVHALRAAFAVFYLEQNPDDLLGLKDLLGHRSLNTTLIYLRRRYKQAGLERVRDLSWSSRSPQQSLRTFRSMGAGGFEPP
jgi:site-specific recombinase XerD